MANSHSVKAVAKYIRMSPHKIRRVIDQIRGRSYQEALMILEFLPYNAGGPIWQVIHSAAANAKHPATPKQLLAPFRLCKSPIISGLITRAIVLTVPSNPITAPLLCGGTH